MSNTNRTSGKITIDVRPPWHREEAIISHFSARPRFQFGHICLFRFVSPGNDRLKRSRHRYIININTEVNSQTADPDPGARLRLRLGTRTIQNQWTRIVFEVYDTAKLTYRCSMQREFSKWFIVNQRFSPESGDSVFQQNWTCLFRFPDIWLKVFFSFHQPSVSFVDRFHFMCGQRL